MAGAEERPWGKFEIIEETETYKIKRITVNPKSRLSIQKHTRRAETWTVVQGEGVAICDALYEADPAQRKMKLGWILKIPVGYVHRMENRTDEPLVFIEVQTGEYFGEDDIIRFADDYGRDLS